VCLHKSFYFIPTRLPRRCHACGVTPRSLLRGKICLRQISAAAAPRCSALRSSRPKAEPSGKRCLHRLRRGGGGREFTSINAKHLYIIKGRTCRYGPINYLRFSGFRHLSSSSTNNPFSRMRTSSKYIFPGCSSD